MNARPDPAPLCSTVTIRNTKRTRGSVWVKRERSRSGFGISRLAGDDEHGSLIIPKATACAFWRFRKFEKTRVSTQITL